MNPIVGSIVALVTPMLDIGDVDYPGLRRLIDWHVAEGTDCMHHCQSETGPSERARNQRHQLAHLPHASDQRTNLHA